MNIHEILASKPHNPHYLSRYIRFISGCQSFNAVNILNYTEKHHVCPKAKDLFPEYKSLNKFRWNRIDLSPRQHFIAHKLLDKTFSTPSTQFALWAMMTLQQVTVKKNRNIKVSSRDYEKIKTSLGEYMSKTKSGVPRSEETKTKIREARSRQIITEETKELWRKNRKGVPKSEEHKRNISLANKGKHSRIQSEEEKQKRALSLLGKNKGRKHQIVECPHCGRSGGLPIMKRHHFDNCKAIPR